MRTISISLDYVLGEITNEVLIGEFKDRNLGVLVDDLTREDVVDLCADHDICIIENEEPDENELGALTDEELEFLMDILHVRGTDTLADDVYQKLKAIRFQQS